MSRERVFVGLSGGVDSSVAALLLKEQGHDVAGVFLRCMNLDGCADEDAEEARRAAAHLGIPFYAWDFEERYRAAVVEPLVAGYRAGGTPNPDVACNREIKFGAFLEAARAAGADAIATGHYARIVQRDGVPHLAAGADAEKDQSYFLWSVGSEALARVRFPLGDLTKPEVRRIAAAAGLPNAARKDSQGICFLGKVPLSGYLRTREASAPGIVRDVAGAPIGEHDGAWLLTIGQRSGFRITAPGRGAATPPYYVAARDVASNGVTVAVAGDPALTIAGVSLMDAVAPLPLGSEPRPVLVRTRYRQSLAAATLTGGERPRVAFARPHPAAAIGQSAVCYDADGTVLAGGIIAETL